MGEPKDFGVFIASSSGFRAGVAEFIKAQTANINKVLKPSSRKDDLSPDDERIVKVTCRLSNDLNDAYIRGFIRIIEACFPEFSGLEKKHQKMRGGGGKRLPRLEALSVIKLVSNPNSHNYPLGQLVLASSSGQINGLHFLEDGRWTTGNSIPTPSATPYEYVSDEEIDEFVFGLTDEQFAQMCKLAPVVFIRS